MNATVLDDAVIGSGCLVAAGSVVLNAKTIEDGSLVGGVPAKFLRALSENEIAQLNEAAGHYVELSKKYVKRV